MIELSMLNLKLELIAWCCKLIEGSLIGISFRKLGEELLAQYRQVGEGSLIESKRVTAVIEKGRWKEYNPNLIVNV